MHLESAKCFVVGQGHQGQHFPVDLDGSGWTGWKHLLPVAAFLAVEEQVPHAVSGHLVCASALSDLGARGGWVLVPPEKLELQGDGGMGEGTHNTSHFSRLLSRGLLQSPELGSNPTSWLRKEISTVPLQRLQILPGRQALSTSRRELGHCRWVLVPALTIGPAI